MTDLAQRRVAIIDFITQTFSEDDLDRSISEHYGITYGKARELAQARGKERLDDDEYDEIRRQKQQERPGEGIFFEDYDELVRYQTQSLDQMSEGQIASIEILIQMVPTIDIMDKEGMSPWKSSGFVFNKNGRIVIFHER